MLFGSTWKYSKTKGGCGTSHYAGNLAFVMSAIEEAKSIRRKLLPAIPVGVEPAVSPALAFLPRSPNVSTRAPPTKVARSQGLSSEGEDSCVRVAVRVRPFSKR